MEITQTITTSTAFQYNLSLTAYGDLLGMNGTEAPSFQPPYNSIISVLLATLAAVISAGTVSGNVLVLTAFIVDRRIRQPSNYLIASLAVNDILIGLFSMPLYTLYLLKGFWPLSSLLCNLWLSLDYTVCLVSQYTVFLITLDRFCMVKVPAKYHNWRTKTKIQALVVVVWLVPALVFFTSIMGWHDFTKEPRRPREDCYAQFQTNSLFTAVLVICYYWITLIVMLGLYIGIYRVALRLHIRVKEKQSRLKTMKSMSSDFQKNTYDLLSVETTTTSSSLLKPSGDNMKVVREDSDLSSDSTPIEQSSVNCVTQTTCAEEPAKNRSSCQKCFGNICQQRNHKSSKVSSPRISSKSENRARKALRTITVIVGAFVLCWTPYHIVVLIDAFCPSKNPSCSINEKFYQFTYWLCYINSPLNPFCYALANQQFKKTFIRIIKCEYFRNAGQH